ncbi:MAG: TIGR00266 family protein [Armatimonadetes bacterium CG2_30_66_41]|nr:TIGR00266 family protein [Armatimonadota bacterium]OIO93855.1 MAG: TIGR00266 family protein [Armatimonadetes bacterium CG2_30_66_41]PIU87757.1 MAG: TIGR00266 family protein [Armatimonadetes bacterium CG06_land_8_20_14_3_00_66_21]PIW16282.1 MAG: TIGR00266 family protein [Armatimonadetes bacterium CG17_big_fil_post_rev_8_21_14_2_50_66_6]PIX41191.1 MAG: TIGR00266 family protein [Armatimonadetes bacterium CG_4_8_14_3_um_filter_66_20]PJB76271.1 MAG: TIGR00266 family protein [Armatimonadetes bact
MDYQINGTVMQTVELTMKGGESVHTESGGMAWHTGDFRMATNMAGGVLGAIGRKLAGESLFMTTYTCESATGKLTFASCFPGHLRAVPLAAGQSMICQKDAFLCAETTVTLATHWRRKLGVGLLGGEGFVLQKLTGPGLAFVEIAGETTEVELAAGEVLKVDTGHVAMHEPDVQFDVEMVKGVTNVLFGGEGLVLARLTGPGKVWLQSMPIANLAARIVPFVPSKG